MPFFSATASQAAPAPRVAFAQEDGAEAVSDREMGSSEVVRSSSGYSSRYRSRPSRESRSPP